MAHGSYSIVSFDSASMVGNFSISSNTHTRLLALSVNDSIW